MKKIGYVIVNEREEFLHKYQIDGFTIARLWSKAPGLSHIFQTRSQAAKVVKKLEIPGKAWVMQLAETSTKYILICDREVRPKWLDA